MSTSYYPHVTVGVTIPWEKVKEDVTYKVASCACVDKGSGNYCSGCGATIQIGTRTKRVWRQFVEGDGGDYTIGQFSLMMDDSYGDPDPPFAYLGETFGRDESFEGNINEVKKELKQLLKPLGLWDEEAFGIHCWMEIG